MGDYGSIPSRVIPKTYNR